MLGVCSWSLKPASPVDLVEQINAAGCRAMQLALDPIRTGLWDEDETFDRLADAGITVRSGMMAMRGEDYTTIDSIARTGGVRPEETRTDNRDAAIENARVASRHHIGLVTFHAGFLPDEPGDTERRRMIDRLAEIASIYAHEGVRVGLETGQEDAETLLGVLDEIDGAIDGVVGDAKIGVNFDPANILLYGAGDPVAALERLAPRVVQLHIKDANPSPEPGVWGEEVPVGAG